MPRTVSVPAISPPLRSRSCGNASETKWICGNFARVEKFRRLHPVLVLVVAHRDRADIDARIGYDAGVLVVDRDRALHLAEAAVHADQPEHLDLELGGRAYRIER
jgi:hypothetical protein